MGAKSSFQSRRDAGVTLMEIIAALAIISVIVVGALALYQSAKSSEEATRLIADAMAIQTAVRSVYMGETGYEVFSDFSTRCRDILCVVRFYGDRIL